MSVKAVLRIAPIYNGEVGERSREMFQHGALEPLDRTTLIPVVVNHDLTRQVGVVREIVYWPEPGGRWAFARCEIDDAPDWLHRGGAVSFSHRPILETAMPGGWSRVLRSAVDEVSILSPGVEGYEPLARVVLIERSSATGIGLRSSAGVSPATAAAGRAHGVAANAGETIIYGGAAIRRPGGRVLGVR